LIGSLVLWGFHVHFFSVFDFGLNLVVLTLLANFFVYVGILNQLFFNQNVCFVIFEGTSLVEFEVFWSEHVGNDWSIPKEFLLDLFCLLILTKATSQEIAGFDLGCGSASLISGAWDFLVSEIGSTFLCNQIAILS